MLALPYMDFIAGTESTPQAQSGAGDQAWCKMKFEFRMNKLTATLYSGDSKLVSFILYPKFLKILKL